MSAVSAGLSVNVAVGDLEDAMKDVTITLPEAEARAFVALSEYISDRLRELVDIIEADNARMSLSDYQRSNARLDYPLCNGKLILSDYQIFGHVADVIGEAVKAASEGKGDGE